MDVLHSRYRLFWLSDFTKEIQRRFPEHYDIFKNGQGIDETSCPTMRLDRVGDNSFAVSWEVPDIDSLPASDETTLNQRVTRLLKRGITGKPKGHHFPSAKTSSHSVYYRDPMVKAWVLDNAKGTCELCDELGPFLDKTGHHFLEEHHVIPLAEGGSDTIENAVALCPNCHRKCHLGQDIESTRMELLDKVDRIISVASAN